MKPILFNEPKLYGNELNYVKDAIQRGHISGDGYYSREVSTFFAKTYNFNHTLLTTSCTHALEICALLIDLQEGDEVIVPSYTFTSTALAFEVHGAKIVFCDSGADHPNMDVDNLEALITDKTKAIVAVHYAGCSVDMEKLLVLKNKYNLILIEDAAQAVHNRTKTDEWLGSMSDLSCFSFHETKNINCGEGGLLVINNEDFLERAEIIRDKGTNRKKFFRGEVDKYRWVDVGSSYALSDLNASYLLGQLEKIDDIHTYRSTLWNTYFERLNQPDIKEHFRLPTVPGHSYNNWHIFYLVSTSNQIRNGLIEYLKSHNILAVFHYQSLHNSPYVQNKYSDIPELPNAKIYSDNLVRLPLHGNLNPEDIIFITDYIHEYCQNL